MFSLRGKYVFFTVNLKFGIIFKLPYLAKVSHLEPHYTTSAHDFALNVQRH